MFAYKSDVLYSDKFPGEKKTHYANNETFPNTLMNKVHNSIILLLSKCRNVSDLAVNSRMSFKNTSLSNGICFREKYYKHFQVYY